LKPAATRADLVRQIAALGIERGMLIVVHASFRATGPVEGGPAGLIEALHEGVGRTGTIVMPSMSDVDDEPFDRFRTPCRSLGIVADTFWRLPGVVRSDSPHSFAAWGPLAAAITGPHPPEVPHGPDSPVGRVHDLDGHVLLLGVGHDGNTTIHLAESLAGVPYRLPHHCTVLRDGRPSRVDYLEIDHCCRGFVRVGDWLARRGRERRGVVGHGPARLMLSRDVVDTVVEELRDDRRRLLCPAGTGCEECEAAVRAVTS
jgi:aminoglycoside 3-N-acetyltransferase